MRPFIHEDFLLETPAAVDLYHRFVRDLPIIDYHCHLPVEQIARDHRFRSITEVWLEGDHYKWRALRANGVAERYCTGDASDWEKFEAWARTAPETLRNPLYQWTQMELKRPFGIEELLDERTARSIFERCNARLAEPGFSARGLLVQFKVAAVCTTDDPADSLEHHAALAARRDPETRVYPTFRPDKAWVVEDPQAWNAWVNRLEAAAALSIGSFAELFQALERRHAAFHAAGCRASDHGLERIDAEPWTDAEIARSFDRLRRGQALDVGEARRFRSALLHQLALLDHSRGWVQQFHLEALRDNNSRLGRQLGANGGFDSIGDFDQAPSMARFLNRLDDTNQLAKTILYNVNPRDNELFASMIGNFQDGVYSPASSAWSPIRAVFYRTLATSTSAGFCAICSATTSSSASSPTIAACLGGWRRTSPSSMRAGTSAWSSGVSGRSEKRLGLRSKAHAFGRDNVVPDRISTGLRSGRCRPDWVEAVGKYSQRRGLFSTFCRVVEQRVGVNACRQGFTPTRT